MSKPSIKHDFIVSTGEFVGTYLFLLLGEGAAKTASLTHYASSVSPDERPTSLGSETVVFVSLSFGLSLMVTAWMFYRISGSLFNPAITFALWLIGAVHWRRAILLVVAQMAAGIAAAATVQGLTPYGGTASVVKLEKGVTIAQGLILEAVLTAVLIFSVLMLAAEKHKATFMAPLVIGMTLFVCHLFGVLWTGCSLNPARSFGPSVVEGVWPSYEWLYYVGPFIGSLLAVAVYLILKAVDYTSIYTGQDADHFDGEALVGIPTVWAKRARAVSVGNRKRNVSHSIVVVGNGESSSGNNLKSNKDLSSEPTTPTTFVTPMPLDGVKRNSEIDLEKGHEALGLGLPQQQQHQQQAPTMIVTAEMAEQMGMGNGNGIEIPTMNAKGQDVGGILAPASTGQGLAANSFVRDAISS